MMRIIGITGGIGCGKSTLISMIKDRCKVLIIDTDTIAKRLMSPDNISYNLIVEYFGNEIISEIKEIDRKKLSKIVMSDKNKLHKLNSFTHPYVIEEIKEIIKINENSY